ncbi:Homeobox protein goosecoid-2 [Manis javanica]|nr:Homeobox protein goosecoid-2 [Manis javanica]
MQEPGSFGGSALSSRPPRQRQERTVYSKEQQQELEKRFQMNQYPTYVEREALAARLNLREQQVQGPPSSVVSRYPEGDYCEDEDSDPKTLLDL